MEQHVTAVVTVLVSISIGLIGFFAKGIASRLEKLEATVHQYVRLFADRESNAEAHKALYARTDSLDRRVTVLEAKVEIPKSQNVKKDETNF